MYKNIFNKKPEFLQRFPKTGQPATAYAEYQYKHHS